jgi:acetolactate synthase-1/2/3 large subunit
MDDKIDPQFPAAAEQGQESAAEVLLKSLKSNGIDYFFCNSGTDFAPVAEAYARSFATHASVPKPMVVPHENCAVAMAHGYYMMTERPQAVMVHTSVGTANTINAIADASRDNVPVLLMAGRNPITEQGLLGSRNAHIHWGQEMFDQAGMLREFVKWDYEMRLPVQADSLVPRALDVMMAAPRGPAYLMLPREVLGAGKPSSNRPPPPHSAPAGAFPNPDAIERLADLIVAAERPLVITAAAGRWPSGMRALAHVAERFALPVVTFCARYMCLPNSHPMHMGYHPRPLLADADLVIALDIDVPWFPSTDQPQHDCKVVQIGDDPAFVRYPMRGFPCDLSITADTLAALAAIDLALERRGYEKDKRLEPRRQRLAEKRMKIRNEWKAAGDAAAKQDTIKLEYLSRCLGEVLPNDAVVVNEYWLKGEQCPREEAGTYFSTSSAGGLGWALGAALGAKLAAPEKLVVATVGDGSYMFANPTACHWVAEAYDLPVLTVIYNNQAYNAVRRATLNMYGKGAAAADDAMILADLHPSPAFEKAAEMSGGFGERVEKPADLPGALARAIKVVRDEGRQAVLNVISTH